MPDLSILPQIYWLVFTLGELQNTKCYCARLWQCQDKTLHHRQQLELSPECLIKHLVLFVKVCCFVQNCILRCAHYFVAHIHLCCTHFLERHLSSAGLFVFRQFLVKYGLWCVWNSFDDIKIKFFDRISFDCVKAKQQDCMHLCPNKKRTPPWRFWED